MKLDARSTAMKIAKSEKGLATLEILPLLLIFVMLMAYSLGAFGIIHTGIMYSISSRTYAFETFRNRANLVYFRDNEKKGTADFRQFRDTGMRMHAVFNEERPTGRGDAWFPSERSIRMGMPLEPDGQSRTNLDIHNSQVHQIQPKKRNSRVSVNPVWIQVQYGICINSKCGE